MNLADFKKSKFTRALLIGPTGRGKTVAAASWPGKTLIFDFEKRHAPIIDWYPDRLKDYEVLEISPSNFWEVYVDKMKQLSDYNPYQNIIIDSVTSATTTVVMMQMIAKGAIGNFTGKNEKGGSKVTKGGIAVPGWDEFNGEAMIFSHMLEVLKSFECNLFVSAHPVARTKIGEGDKGGKYTSITTFGPKVESIIPTYFDEVWYFDYEFDYTTAKTVLKRNVHTAPTSTYPDAKTALKGLPKELDITDKNLYDVVKEYL